jgi:uncharacterized membrane protein
VKSIAATSYTMSISRPIKSVTMRVHPLRPFVALESPVCYLSPIVPWSARVALVLAFHLLTACSSSDARDKPDAAPPPATSCTAPEQAPTFADLEQGILLVCRQCHSAAVTGDARHSAPPGMDFDTYEQFASAGETAEYFVRYGMMPPADVQGPTEEQRQQLYDWVLCGKPR